MALTPITSSCDLDRKANDVLLGESSVTVLLELLMKAFFRFSSPILPVVLAVAVLLEAAEGS